MKCIAIEFAKLRFYENWMGIALIEKSLYCVLANPTHIIQVSLYLFPKQKKIDDNLCKNHDMLGCT